MASQIPRHHPQEMSEAARRIIVLGIGVLSVVAYGVVGYMFFGHAPLESLYRTVLVLTTVGFTPEVKPDGLEKIFTSSLAFFGVTLFLSIIAVATSVSTAGQLRSAGRRRRMQKQIDRLNDHFIVCAYGRVGRAVAREFESEGVPFVVIDNEPETTELMHADGVHHIIGDSTREAILRQAGVERARGLICAVDSDAANVYIALTARAVKPDLFIVARASDPESPERLYRANVDRVISPYVSSGRHMALLALRPRVIDYLDIAGLGDSTLRLEETLIEKGSPFEGRSVAEASGEGLPILLRRASDGELVANPADDEKVAAGDLIVTVGAPRPGRRTDA